MLSKASDSELRPANPASIPGYAIRLIGILLLPHASLLVREFLCPDPLLTALYHNGSGESADQGLAKAQSILASPCNMATVVRLTTLLLRTISKCQLIKEIWTRPLHGGGTSIQGSLAANYFEYGREKHFERKRDSVSTILLSTALLHPNPR
jgi:hypothetical protein